MRFISIGLLALLLSACSGGGGGGGGVSLPTPTKAPTSTPTTATPIASPTATAVITAPPIITPTTKPTTAPTTVPTTNPSGNPTTVPTTVPTTAPTTKPTTAPATPSPAPSGPTAAPTSSPLPTTGSFLPAAYGNTWVFSDGSYIQDAGQNLIQGSNQYAELYDLFDYGGNYLGYIQFLHAPWPNLGLNGASVTNDNLVNIADVEDAFSDGGDPAYFTGGLLYYNLTQTVFPGMPMADDSITTGNEAYLLSRPPPNYGGEYSAYACQCQNTPLNFPSGNEANTTVIATPTSQPYPTIGAPTQQLTVVPATLTYLPYGGVPSSTTIGFAQGVGFTSLAYSYEFSYTNPPPKYLNSFYNVNEGLEHTGKIRRMTQRPANVQFHHGSLVDIFKRM